MDFLECIFIKKFIKIFSQIPKQNKLCLLRGHMFLTKIELTIMKSYLI